MINRRLKRKAKYKILDLLNTAIENKDINLISELEPKLTKLLKRPHNLILLSDAYKYSHGDFYPKNTTKIISYLESRGGKFDEVVFFGLQMMLKKYLEDVAILKEDVDEAYEYLGNELGVFGRENVFDRSRFDYIVEKHGGRLPIEIKGVPEGVSVGVKNVLMTIENTDPECAWLTNFLETLLLQVWFPITVSTLSREVKKIAKRNFRKNSDLPTDVQDYVLQYVLNDFGFRGVSSVESAEIGGTSHLVNFNGGDTTVASQAIFNYYNSNIVNESVPATEHSIMTILGEDGEIDMIKRTLETHPSGIVACVMDSFNIFRAITDYLGGPLKELILSRSTEPGNQFVIRPDSGDPKRTLEEVFKLLFEVFGFETNTKGFKVLPPQVRVLQGDGVNINSIIEIYDMMDKLKIAPENLVFGMGGKLLQANIDRDTQNFATKACFAIIDGVEHEVVKSPTEMDSEGNIRKSFKKSKSGKLKLVKEVDGFRTVTSKEDEYSLVKDELVPVFLNGVIVKEYTFEEVRENANINEEKLELI